MLTSPTSASSEGLKFTGGNVTFRCRLELVFRFGQSKSRWMDVHNYDRSLILSNEYKNPGPDFLSSPPRCWCGCRWRYRCSTETGMCPRLSLSISLTYNLLTCILMQKMEQSLLTAVRSCSAQRHTNDQTEWQKRLIWRQQHELRETDKLVNPTSKIADPRTNSKTIILATWWCSQSVQTYVDSSKEVLSRGLVRRSLSFIFKSMTCYELKNLLFTRWSVIVWQFRINLELKSF